MNQQSDRIGLTECVERNRTHKALPTGGCEPGVNRRISSGKNNTNIVRKQWHEHLPKPCVHEPEDFVVVKHKQNSITERLQTSRGLFNPGDWTTNRDFEFL